MRAMNHSKSHANAGGQIAIAHTLTGGGFDASEDGTGRGTPLVAAFRTTGNDGAYDAGGVSPCLGTATDPNHTVLLEPQGVSLRGRDGGGTAELTKGAAPALRASQGGGDKPHVLASMTVRRITPTEAARLQGFPDDYLSVTYRKKPAADGPKYRALGNSFATPVVKWIGMKIKNAISTS